MGDLQTYSQHEIQRYLQHKMSLQEMHDFEKALMDDPFLADAIEGFSTIDEALAEQHLLTIESELGGKKEKAKIVSLAVKKTAWWKVAAIVLVIVTGGAFSYTLFNTGAKNTAEQMAASEIDTRESQQDSIGPVNKPLAQLELLPPKVVINKKPAPPLQKNSIENQEGNRYEQSSTNPVGSEASGTTVMHDKAFNAPLMAARSAVPFEEGAQNKSKMLQPSMQPSNEFKGKVLDKAGEPLPFASVRVNNSTEGTVADAKGNFTLKAPDSILQVNVKSLGYGATMAEIKSNVPGNTIILEEVNSGLSDIIIANEQYERTKRNAPNANGNAEPDGGWKNFQQYMHQKIDSLKTSDNDVYFDGDVVMEFLIDEEGRPTNITTIEPGNKTFAEKAEQILLKGPKWRSIKKEKKVKVIIPY